MYIFTDKSTVITYHSWHLARKALLSTKLLPGGLLLFGLLCSQAFAAFTLNGTRFIYPSDQKNISFEVTNHMNSTYGGQVWIDNVSTPADTPILIPAPTFFKVGPQQKQVLRILDINDALLPKDKESLFKLNVQEIPPTAKTKGNSIAIAMNTQVKLIYRPESLAAGRQDAEKQLQLKQQDDQTVLVNPTPYYFAVVALYSGNNNHTPRVPLKENVLSVIGTFPPHSQQALGIKLTPPITLDAVDDWGGTRSYTISTLTQ